MIVFQVVDEFARTRYFIEGIGIGVPGPVVKGIVLGAQNFVGMNRSKQK